MRLPFLNKFKHDIVYIVATGESLKGFDFGLLCRKKVIAVNWAYLYVKHNLIVALDFKDEQINGIPVLNFKNIELSNKFYDKLDYNMKAGWNSGLMAIAVAFHLGAEKVNLLGFDVGWKHQRYFYGHRELPGVDQTRHLPYFEYFKDYPVINWGMSSLIECFDKRPLQELEQNLVYEKLEQVI
jgi:hypothetical protein